MAKSLLEYADWLVEKGTRFPAPPKPQPQSARGALKPLPGMRAVLWDLYGTLLRIADGVLLFEHPQLIRMEVALDKTVKEFNMWNSMTRKPGAPWEYMHQIYMGLLAEARLAASPRKGEPVEVQSAQLWRKILAKLEQKDYEFDRSLYGDIDDLSLKIAYFFHSALQGLEASPGAATAAAAIQQAGLRQGLIADGQPFSLVQLIRALRPAPDGPQGNWLSPELTTLSWQLGIRKPGRSLFSTTLDQLKKLGIEPAEVVYISSRLPQDLLVARSLGMKTILYAGDKLSLVATNDQLRDPEQRPDRLLTDLSQLRDILGV